jgi:hypothetical protein
MEFTQEKIYTDCKILFGFTNKEAYSIVIAQRSMSIHEECPNNISSPKVQMGLRFANREPVIIEGENILFELPNYQSLANSDQHTYIIILQSSYDTTLTAINNVIDLTTIGYQGGLNPSGIISLPYANIQSINLFGNLVYGKKSFEIPSNSNLIANNTRNYVTVINNDNGDINTPWSRTSIYQKGSSNEIILNDESLSSDENRTIENLKALATPVLAAIFSGFLSFALGLFLGKQNDDTIPSLTTTNIQGKGPSIVKNQGMPMKPRSKSH